MKLAIMLAVTFFAIGANATDEILIQEKNDWDGISIAITPQTQAVKQGDELRFSLRYDFKRNYRAMNIFALAHNDAPPTSELRFFRQDGTLFAVPRHNGFAVSLPNSVYLMYPQSSISFVTTVSTKAEFAIDPPEIPVGVYQVQLAVYDTISAGHFFQKESPAKSVLFSNVVKCKIVAK